MRSDFHSAVSSHYGLVPAGLLLHVAFLLRPAR